MTKFSFEVPIKHLEDFHEDQDFVFTLSMLYDFVENPLAEQYTDYLIRVKKEGLKTIWLDNSYNETGTADHSHHLGLLYHMWHPAKVISPDNPSWGNVEIENGLLSMRDKGVNAVELICVSSTMEMFKYFAEHHPEINTFAVSYHVRDKWMYDDLIEMREYTNLHYLGFLNPEEVTAVKPQTCDTSMPIKIAMKGISFESWCINGCPHINTSDLGLNGADFFQATMSYDQVKLARYNIKRLKEVCND